MNKDLTFNISLKEFCVGLTRKELKSYFGENFIENVGENITHIYVNKMYYQCAMDHVWADRQSDVCTDVWIDFERNEMEPKLTDASFMGMPLTKKESSTIISIVVDMADEEPRKKINDVSVLRKLIEIAEEKKELEKDLLFAAGKLNSLPYFAIGACIYITNNDSITKGIIKSIHMTESDTIYSYKTEGTNELLTFRKYDIGQTVFETEKEAEISMTVERDFDREL